MSKHLSWMAQQLSKNLEKGKKIFPAIIYHFRDPHPFIVFGTLLSIGLLFKGQGGVKAISSGLTAVVKVSKV